MDKEIVKLIEDSYTNIKISLLVSSKGYDDFLKLYNNLLSSSIFIKDVEMLVKIDNLNQKYFDLLKDSPFQFKILSYPPYNARYSNHIFFNDLCKISHGKLIWPIYEDCQIVKGDWFHCFMKYIDRKICKDNIFNIAIPMDNGRGCKQICGANIISREWYEFFGTVSPYPNLDRWLSELSRGVDRYECFSHDELITYFPKGHRTLSKKQRKELFYPSLKKYIYRFNNRYKHTEQRKNNE